MDERPWAVVQHVPYEGPGLIATIARTRSIPLQVHRLDLGASLPSLDGLGALIVMGGPMGVGDEARFPHLAGERRLLAEAVARELPVLGICLGAQLLAAALGARVHRGTSEVGLAPVRLTDEGCVDRVLDAAAAPALAPHLPPSVAPPGDETLRTGMAVLDAFATLATQRQRSSR